MKIESIVKNVGTVKNNLQVTIKNIFTGRKRTFANKQKAIKFIRRNGEFEWEFIYD